MTEGAPSISWQGSIPLVTSRFFQRDVFLALGIAMLSSYTIVVVAGVLFARGPVFLPWQFPVFGFVVFWVLFELIALVVLGSSVDATFTVDAEGMSVTAGARVRKINKVVMVLALLSGRGGAIGSALLAQSREETLVRWEAVNHVTFYPQDHVIQVRDLGLRMTRLFCPADRYAEIAQRVRDEVAHARAAHPPRPFAWRALIRRVATDMLVAGAFVLSMAWAPDDAGGFLLAAAGAAALAEWFDTWWLGRVLGVVSLAGTLMAAGVIAFLALDRTTYEGLFTIYCYDHDTPLLVISCIGMLVLSVLALRRVFARADAVN